MTTTKTDSLLFTATDAAKSAGITELDLRALEPDDFGTPAHWKMVGNSVVYTEREIELFVDALTKAGKITLASRLHAMLVQERQERLTPARGLIEPGPKSSEPYYRSHPTLS